jgi:hypothetical protein
MTRSRAIRDRVPRDQAAQRSDTCGTLREISVSAGASQWISWPGQRSQPALPSLHEAPRPQRSRLPMCQGPRRAYKRCHGYPGLARLSDRSRRTEVQSALICRRTGSCQRKAKQECAEKCDTKENCSDLPTEPRAAPPGQHGLVSGRTRPVKLSLKYHRSPSITIAGFCRIIRCREFGKVACALTRAEHRGRTLIHGRDRSAVPLGNLGHRNTSPTSSVARYLCDVWTGALGSAAHERATECDNRDRASLTPRPAKRKVSGHRIQRARC